MQSALKLIARPGGPTEKPYNLLVVRLLLFINKIDSQSCDLWKLVDFDGHYFNLIILLRFK